MVKIDTELYRATRFTKEEIAEIEKLIKQAPSEASLKAKISAGIICLKEGIESASSYIVDDSSEANEEMKEKVLKNLQKRKEFLDRIMERLA